MNGKGESLRNVYDRRELLRTGGSAATLAAARLLAPGVFSGCSAQQAVAATTSSAAAPVKVGILHSQTGVMGMSESSLRDAEMLAIEEINADGGVLGRPIEAVVEDTRSRFTDVFPAKATKLLTQDRVAAVFGCWTSVSRKAVVPVFERLNGLLFYPLQYEGNESSFNVIYGGSVPNQQILPAVDWLLSDAGGARKRLFLIGSDYVFPWTVEYILERYLPSLNRSDVQIVGHYYAPLSEFDFAPAVSAIEQAQPDAILSTINGEGNVHFFAELAKRGIGSNEIPVMSTSVGEDELRSMKGETISGHYSAWSYFQSLDTPRNRRFVRRFQNEHGDDRVISDPMEAAYSLVYLWKQSVERAQSIEVDAVRDAFAKNIEFAAPGGRIRLDPRNYHTYKRFRIGRARADLQFDLVHESPDWIAPEPYPSVAFPGWEVDWSRGGLTRGPAVDIHRPS
ncbi:MAG: ABC transporter substrate-binding protein [Pirellulales bacterium]